MFKFQTQPVPNPISYFMHQEPEVFHKLETLVNHIVELPAPFLLLLTRCLCMAGGIIQILFQVGNYHWFSKVLTYISKELAMLCICGLGEGIWQGTVRSHRDFSFSSQRDLFTWITYRMDAQNAFHSCNRQNLYNHLHLSCHAKLNTCKQSIQGTAYRCSSHLYHHRRQWRNRV